METLLLQINTDEYILVTIYLFTNKKVRKSDYMSNNETHDLFSLRFSLYC